MDSVDTKSINSEEDQGLLGHHAHGLTVLTCAVFLVGEMAGSGVLALPDALENTGWIGIVVIALICAVSAYTGHILGRCWIIVQDRYPEMRGHIRYPYPAMGQVTFGKPGRILISFATNSALFGTAVVFLLLASQNIQLIVSQLFHHNWSFCYWLLVVAGVLLPCTWPGTPKDFWPVGIGAMSATSIACIILVVVMGTDSSTAPPVKHRQTDLLSFAMAFGTIAYACCGHPVFPTLQTDMREPTKFGRSAVLAYLVMAAMYIPVAVAGYFVYGQDVKENILLTVSSGAPLIIVEFLITGHLVCSFIIVVNPVCQEVEDIIGVARHFSIQRVLSRTVVCLLILFVAESVPHFGAVLSLVGGSALTLLAFIAPPVFYLKLASTPGDWGPVHVSLHEKVFNVEIILVGILAGVASTYSALKVLASPDSLTPPCYVDVKAATG